MNRYSTVNGSKESNCIVLYLHEVSPTEIECNTFSPSLQRDGTWLTFYANKRGFTVNNEDDKENIEED